MLRAVNGGVSSRYHGVLAAWQKYDVFYGHINSKHRITFSNELQREQIKCRTNGGKYVLICYRKLNSKVSILTKYIC